jgi:hypothetical protein
MSGQNMVHLWTPTIDSYRVVEINLVKVREH